MSLISRFFHPRPLRFLMSPVWIVVLFWVATVLTNFSQGTWLAGWDNTMPELNFLASFAKTFTGVWQEYRGLGLLDGMAHAANTVHLMFIWLLNRIVPLSAVRYVFIFSMHLLGGLGVYALISRKLLKEKPHRLLIAALGALFYMFNIGTIQMFYAPLELFIIHFGFLPWLLLTLGNLLEEMNRRNMILFFFVNLLAVSQAHVPSIFIVYFLAVVGFSLWYVSAQKEYQTKKLLLKKTATVLGLLFIVNAFWGLPFVFSSLSNAGTITDSKINQMSNPEVILRNRAFGDFSSTALLKGFSLDYGDFVSLTQNDLMMRPWVDHIGKWPVTAISWLFFGLVIAGIVRIIKKRQSHVYPFLGLFIMSFLMLGSDIPVLSLFPKTLSLIVPFFAEVFRFTFTKFIIAYAFSYAVLLSFGLVWLLDWVKKKHLKISIGTAVVMVIAIYSLPVFSGNFLYKKMRVTIPNEYFQLHSYFKNQNQSERIAILPSPHHWGWTTYSWGYRGSGFLWYALGQPTTDRAFDPWSNYNEQFYWELSRAIDSNNTTLFSQIMKKYDIGWVIVDESILDAVNSQLTNGAKLKTYLAEVSEVSQAAQYGFLTIYKVAEPEVKKDFISVSYDLPQVYNPFRFTWEDKAYGLLGDYVSSESSKPLVIYPYASLFANRLQKDLEFSVTETDTSLVLSSPLPVSAGYRPVFADIFKTEAQVPVALTWEEEQDVVKMAVTYLMPVVRAGTTEYRANPVETFELSLRKCTGSCYLTVNYETTVSLTHNQPVYALLKTDIPNTIGVYSGEGVALYDYIFLDPANQVSKGLRYEAFPTEKITGVEVEVKKVSAHPLDTNLALNTGHEARNCRSTESGMFDRVEWEGSGIEYTAQKASSCDHYYIQNLHHHTGYITAIETENISGLPFKFGVQNAAAHRSELDTMLSESKTPITNWLVVPPSGKYDKGYTFYFDTVSFGREKAVNRLQSIRVWPLPYEFISQLKFVNPSVKPEKTVSRNDFEVTKKAVWWYEVHLSPSDHNQTDRNTTVKLSQAYHPGWVALARTDNGWQVLPHVKISNWANGWEIDQLIIKNEKLKVEANNPPASNNQTATTHNSPPTTIYIFFWPQALEYLGFLLLGGGVLFILRRK